MVPLTKQPNHTFTGSCLGRYPLRPAGLFFPFKAIWFVPGITPFSLMVALATWHDRNDGTFLKRLAIAGVAPEQIDYVLYTHLHADHCGWNTRLVDGRWIPTFPNARYIIARREFEAAKAGSGDPEERTYAENVLPIAEAGRAVLVAMDHALDDGVWLQPTPGHTAGHVAIRVRSQEVEAVFSGDIMHRPMQCIYPDWNFRYDADPDQAGRTRRAFLEAWATSSTAVRVAAKPWIWSAARSSIDFISQDLIAG